MKLFLVTALSLISSVAMADGFRCQNSVFRAKVFNETQPERGTRNPAVLIVSEKDDGTLATLVGDEIVKTNSDSSVTYEGQTNSRVDGRFVGVALEIESQPVAEGPLAGLYLAKLFINADGLNRQSLLSCEHYLKSDRE